MPMIHGISFHGSFFIALAISVMFGIMLWAVETITLGIAAFGQIAAWVLLSCG